MRETKSICCYCGVGCGVIIASDDARIAGVRGDPEHPANFGKLCTKGATLHLTARHDTRALYPEQREARGLARSRVTWDEALDRIAVKFAGLIKDLWRMYAPHKVKLAVSGCPRNCAEATIKDVGVIGVDSGWEIYVAGNGGIKAEVAQFLCKVNTAAEVLEYAGAFLQLYREEGRYLDRTVHYVARAGLDYIKRRVVDDGDNRKALYARLQYALSGEKDPWQERAAGAAKHEFELLEV